MRFLLIALAALPVWGQTSDWQSGVAQVVAEGKTPGSGFVVAVRSGRAYIVTCAHVVAGDPKLVVRFHADPEERYSATLRDYREPGVRTWPCLLWTKHLRVCELWIVRRTPRLRE